MTTSNLFDFDHPYGTAVWGPSLIAFLLFAVLVYLFETWLDVRQHKLYAIAQRPKEITYASDDDFRKAQAYGHDKSAFHLVQTAVEHVKMIISLYLLQMPFLWRLSAQLLRMVGYAKPHQHELMMMVVMFALDTVLETLLSLPWSAYKTFVIEDRHGFRTASQTVSLFITDTIKGLVLNIGIAGPILAALVYIIQWGGSRAYIYVGGFLVILQIIALPLYSHVIQPCFNKVEPLPAGELRSAIEALAKRINFPLSEIFVIDGSKRSNHSNAYFYGLFKHKRIVLFDTLLKQCSQAQIVSVLAHELGHWKHSHTLKGMVLTNIQLVAMFALYGFVMESELNERLLRDFGFNKHDQTQYVVGGEGYHFPTYPSLLIFMCMFSPVSHLMQFIGHVISRRFEFQADAFASSLGYQKELQEALIVLQQQNKGTMIPDPLYSAYHYSHPPLLERIRALEKGTKKVQ